jgi:serine/threonine-protein kinase RsbW
MGQNRSSAPGSNGGPPWPLERGRLPFRFRLWLPSTNKALNEVARRARKVADRCGCNEDRQDDVEIAVREAVANAIRHGNGERARARIFVRCYGGPDVGLLFFVRDQGQGFDPERVPDPRDADRMELHHGRGLLIMRALMDRVAYRRGGRELRMFSAHRAV